MKSKVEKADQVLFSHPPTVEVVALKNNNKEIYFVNKRNFYEKYEDFVALFVPLIFISYPCLMLFAYNQAKDAK